MVCVPQAGLIWRKTCTMACMMTARQILLLFGFFLSMFYIFKYGAVTATENQSHVCQELHNLQAETIADVSPIIRADISDDEFEVKLQAAMRTLQKSGALAARQNKIIMLQSRLGNMSCPAPSFTELAKLAAQS